MPFLLALRRECVDGHPADAGEPLNDEQHLQRLRYRFECLEVLLLDSQSVGMIKLLRGSAVWEILQFQLSAPMQGRGIGRAVLGQVIAQAEAAGVGLAACVVKDNPARQLYESLGFRVVGEDMHEFHMRRP